MRNDLPPDGSIPAHSTRSGRRLTFWRRFGYRLLGRLGWLVVEMVWRSARVRIEGEQQLRDLHARYGVLIPVCWHQHLLFCSRYLASGRVPGLQVGFLISPSVDGEGPALLARLHGAVVIRGSSTYTGTWAVRQLSKRVKEDHVSPLITPDGPRGPRFKFKGGALTVAQLCEVPVVPLAYAARPAKIFRTWDKFVLPMPFARIALVVGEPVMPPRKLSAEEAEASYVDMERRLHACYVRAVELLDAP